MAQDVETIQVHYIDQTKGKGIYRINAADFDPAIHKHITAKESAAADKAADADKDKK